MYIKYKLQKKQVSHDGGVTWVDVVPLEQRVGESAGTYNTLEECEGDYSTQYLTIESLENGNVIYWKYGAYTTTTKTISVSTDGGQTWTEYASSSGGSGTTIATLNNGNKLLIKGQNNTYAYNRFASTKTFNVYGNIMSLISGDTFENVDTLTNIRSFSYLFSGATGLVDAENLVLPATTLTYYCYQYMFYNCTSLTTAPALPATTLVDACYQYMFAGCSNLNYVKCLATDISATQSTVYWLNGVASSGTFVKASSMTGWTTGANGIPNNWNVQNA